MTDFQVVNSEKHEQNPPVPLIYFLTLVAQISVFSEGFEMGSTSGAILLVHNNKHIHLTSIWQELILAGAMPSAAISCLIAGWFCDRFGRKKCVMFSCSCFILGAVVTATAPSKEVLLIGRLLTGSGIGFACATTAVYIAECSPSHMRGRLVSMCQPFLTVGILFGTIIAALFSYDKVNGWRYIWGIQAIFSCIQFVALIFLPESPRWFIQKSRKEEAMKSLIRIRKTKHVEEEMQEIESNFKEVQESIENSGGGNLFVRMFKSYSVRRALMVGCGLHLFAQFSGVNTVIYYSGTIIQMSGIGNVTNAIWNSVIVNSVTLAFSIIGVWFVDSVGRRKLAIIGLLGLFFSSLCIGTTFLMAAIYSPMVNTTNDFLNNTCSTYSQCNDCVSDVHCGFCYKDTSDIMNSACLPVNNTAQLLSKVGACNSSLNLSKYSMKWAHDYCPVSFSWVAITGLALFLMFYATGMGPLPWTVNAEIYPLWARSMGSGMGAMTGWFCNLIIAVSFLSFVELIQNYGVFYLMASMALIGSVFCCFFLFETKNKTLEEIEMLFLAKKQNV